MAKRSRTLSDERPLPAKVAAASTVGGANADADADTEIVEPHVALTLSLHAASYAGDLGQCKALLEQGALAWLQEAACGWTALHYAADAGHADVVKHLLRNGAVWNIVDNLGYTAGDVAYSRNDTAIFEAVVMEGVRAELIKAVLEAQDPGEPPSDDDMSSTSEPTAVDGAASALSSKAASKGPSPGHSNEESEIAGADVGVSTASNNKAFLASRLRYEGTPEGGDERCLDAEGNGVMMGWELPIMRETARLLCGPFRPADPKQNMARLEEKDGDEQGEAAEAKEFAVLNVGFGLGLFDGELQKYSPTRHVIIEPHPDVLAFARTRGWYDRAGVSIFEGTWQEYLQKFEEGEVEAEFDAIYFDTFSEHYKDLHSFFDALPNLLRGPESLFSFFHGLGATSQTFYEVYTRVSELHLREIGLSTEWHEVGMLDKGQVTWEGVSRRYWNIPGAYKLPVCRLDY